MLIFLVACGGTPPEAADHFGGRDAVRVLEPTNGDTVDGTFTLRFRAGEAVAAVAFEAEGVTVTSLAGVVPGEGSMVVTLDEGRYDVALVGLDEAGEELSRDELAIRVSEGGTWVTISSPSDGAEVANPVTFTVATSDDVEEVEMSADGWPIGTIATGGDGEGQLTYTFTGTGYARSIVATAPGASDAISVTVTPEETPTASSFNDVVWSYLESYPTDGTNGYYWPEGGDWCGTTRDIWYLDTLVAEGDPQGRCYCVGLTWEVYMRAWAEVDAATGGDGTINGMSVDDLDSFRVDWFVRDLDGPGPSAAMENYGVGEEITDPSKLLPGDFVQFWRHNGSGHDVIFVDWLAEDGEIVGLEYWSTQSGTEGIGYNSEYFGSSGSSIDPNLVYAARGWMPEDWIAWP
jgi:hypothetical protein